MQNNQVMKDNLKDIQIGEDMKKIINKIRIQLDVWSLYYREYIVGFIIGFIIGAILL